MDDIKPGTVASQEDALLELQHLVVSHPSSGGAVAALRDVSLDLFEGETLALVGESGSGKSTLAYVLCGLLELEPPLNSGEIILGGQKLSLLKETERRRFRSSQIGMIFQNPRAALNPVLRIGDQIADALRPHEPMSARSSWDRSIEILREVGMPDPELLAMRYPHQLSGGMGQRVGIALSLAHRPRLLIADEPTAALDPAIQAQIVDLLRNLKERYGLALLFISHDLALVARVAERVAVMYHGRLVELGPASRVLRRPVHPYSMALLQCQLRLENDRGVLPDIPVLTPARGALPTIPGLAPTSGDPLPGCAFAPRCDRAEADCREQRPRMQESSPGHSAACIKPLH